MIVNDGSRLCLSFIHRFMHNVHHIRNYKKNIIESTKKRNLSETSDSLFKLLPPPALPSSSLRDSKIPKTVCFTWKDKKTIPAHVWKQINQACQGFTVHLFDDQDAYQYLHQYYGSSTASHFDRFSLGAHKADLFRYAFLYREGGLYFDIKTKFVQPVDKMFPLDVPLLTCTVLSAFVAIYQGVIVTFPHNQLFQKALELLLATPMYNVNLVYHVFTQQLYHLCQQYSLSSNLVPGWNTLCFSTDSTKQQPLLLYQEECHSIDCTEKDRYGLCCQIMDKRETTENQLVCYTRHADFPWA